MLLAEIEADAVVVEFTTKMGLPHLPFRFNLIYTLSPAALDPIYDFYS